MSVASPASRSCQRYSRSDTDDRVQLRTREWAPRDGEQPSQPASGRRKHSERGSYRGPQVGWRRCAAGRQGSRALRGQQRTSFRGRDHPTKPIVVQTQYRGRQRSDVVVCDRPDLQLGDAHGLAEQLGEQRVELRPRRPLPTGEDQQERQPREPPADVRREPQAGSVCPVRVVQRDQDRPVRALPNAGLSGQNHHLAHAAGGRFPGRAERRQLPRPAEQRRPTAESQQPD